MAEERQIKIQTLISYMAGINEKITRLAEDYFALPKDVKVTTYDGRAYLNAIDETYDVIMADTIATVFSEVYTVDVVNATNRELFASNNADMLARMDQNRAAMKNADLEELMQKVSDQEVSYYRDIYRTEGLKGLLERIL